MLNNSDTRLIRCLNLKGEVVEIPIAKFRRRVAVYAVIRPDVDILLVRLKVSGKHFLPGGKVETGEGLAVALKREVFEETGLKVVVRNFLTLKQTFFYDELKDEAYDSLSLFFSCSSIAGQAEVASGNDQEPVEPLWLPPISVKREELQSPLDELWDFLLALDYHGLGIGGFEGETADLYQYAQDS